MISKAIQVTRIGTICSNSEQSHVIKFIIQCQRLFRGMRMKCVLPFLLTVFAICLWHEINNLLHLNPTTHKSMEKINAPQKFRSEKLETCCAD